MASWFVISYDATDYDSNTPKDDLTEYLLRDIGIRILESYSDSTIHFFANFEDHPIVLLDALNKGIQERFPDLKYSLSAIASIENRPLIIKDNPKMPLKTDYDADVIRLKKKLNIK